MAKETLSRYVKLSGTFSIMQELDNSGLQDYCQVRAEMSQLVDLYVFSGNLRYQSSWSKSTYAESREFGTVARRSLCSMGLTLFVVLIHGISCSHNFPFPLTGQEWHYGKFDYFDSHLTTPWILEQARDAWLSDRLERLE